MSEAFLPISVVIPTYNSAQTISRALLSISAQDSRPAEVICVDDSSVDETLIAIESFARGALFPIRVVALKHNMGPGHARNVGIALSREPYVAFLDADDAWCWNKLSIQWKLIKTFNLDIIGGHSALATECNAQSPGLGHVQNVSKTRCIFGNPFHTSAVIARKSDLLVFSEDLRYAEDYYLWLRLVHCGYKAAALSEPVSLMFKHPFLENGLSSALFSMERGELGAIWSMRLIHPFLVAPAVLFSVLKYCLRIVRRIANV